MRKIRFITWVRLLAGLFAFTLLLYFIPFGAVRNLVSFDHVVSWVKMAQSNGWTMIVFFLIFTVAVLGFPVTLFPIVGGVLFPYSVAFCLNLAAATLGALIAFGLARLFGREVVHMLLRGWGKSLDKIAAHKGIKSVLLVRWIGFPPFILANYAFGLSGIRFRDYFLGTVIGIAPWMALMTYLAETFWQAALVGGEKGLIKAVISKMMPLTIISVSIAGGIILNYFIRRKSNLPPTYSNL